MGHSNLYYAEYVLKHLRHVLPRLATDLSIFPDRLEARDVFDHLNMPEIVDAIDAVLAEKKRNEEITKIFKEL